MIRINTTRLRWLSAVTVSALWVMTQTGCAVPQAPGKGRCSRLVEPSTRTGYWLYLPQDYVANQGQHPAGERWPLVVTFHGLRPYDDANPQIREWQQEADRYNFIVVAPELRTCDTLIMVPPLSNPDAWYIKKDENAVLAVMDEVTRRTDADPERVLATSFSSGGYLAHYMVNRHPERFSCIAVRGSNFHESLLDPGQVPKYRNMKIGVYFGENDIKLCADESKRAIDWYHIRRFDVTAKKVGGLGHERRPEVAAAFFAASLGVTPKTSPDLGLLVMKDVLPPGMRRSPRREPVTPPVMRIEEPYTPSEVVSSPPPREPITPSPVRIKLPPRTTPSVPPPAPVIARTPSAQRIVPRKSETPKRPIAPTGSESGKVAPRSPERTRAPLVFARRERVDFAPVPATLRIHGNASGRPPLWVNLSVDLPDNLREGASVLWTDNGRPVLSANGFETQILLNEPGQHQIAAHIITADDRKAIVNQNVSVLSPTSQPAIP